jgi:hypothetical protein
MTVTPNNSTNQLPDPPNDPPNDPPPTVAILTATTGDPLLAKTIASVNALTPVDGVHITHWIVVDGQEFDTKARDIVAASAHPPSHITRRVLTLKDNTGGDGYLCHRIIAGFSFLLNETYLCVLDQDNMVHPDHVKAHLTAMREAGDARWSWTLREIVDADGTLQCRDTCESMGSIRHTCLRPGDRLIDTNCYMWRMDLARQLAPLWMVRARESGKMEADRQVAHTLLTHEPVAGSTRQFTVQYRAGVRGGDGGSVSLEFFKRGNLSSRPWDPSAKDVYLFHFNDEGTAHILKRSLKFPLDEWCTTIADDLDKRVNLHNGFENLDALPHDAICLINMYHPDILPLDHLHRLKTTTHKKMTRILYMAEGPNKNHATQWTKEFLETYADIVLTYTETMLDESYSSTIKTVRCPHNAHFISNEHLRDPRIFRQNTGPNTGTVAMVLENRTGRGTYTIDAVPYICTEALRQDMAEGFGPSLTVVGKGWKAWCEAQAEQGRPTPTLGYDSDGKQTDPKSPLDTYQTHDFVLIAENCGGQGSQGYISEKFGDALLSGSIPIYWGETIPIEGEAMLRSGEGQWWIDARRCIPWAAKNNLEEAPLGEKLFRFLQENHYLNEDIIKIMKERVTVIRQSYLAQRGTKAYADAVCKAIGA